jgi:hypothetical protein
MMMEVERERKDEISVVKVEELVIKAKIFLEWSLENRL